MKNYKPVTLFILYFTSVQLHAASQCPELPERTERLLPFNSKVTTEQLKKEIDFLSAVTAHSECKKDDSLYVLLSILNSEKSQIESNIKKLESLEKAGALTPDQTKEKLALQSELTSKTEQLTPYLKAKEEYTSDLNSACKVDQTNTNAINLEMLDCLSSLKIGLELEKTFYVPEDIPDDADNDVRQTLEIANLKNKTKLELVTSDLSVIESFTNTKLETPPSTAGIIKEAIKNNNFGPNANLMIEILEQKSAKIAIFRQKIKVLERNARRVMSQMSYNENCDKTFEEKGKKKHYKTYTEYFSQNKICYLVDNLHFKLEKTLELSYDDYWFENKNIEAEIRDIEDIAKKLEALEESSTKDTIEQVNFLKHANQYFNKYNNTGRFNIGLGAAIFNAPSIKSQLDSPIDLSEFTAHALAPQNVIIEYDVPESQKLTPFIVATMPFVDVTLSFPSYTDTFDTVDNIKAWPQLIEDGDDTKGDVQPDLIENEVDSEKQQDLFLSKTTVKWDFEIDYDINANFKLFSLTHNFWPNSWISRKTHGKNFELALGVGMTNIKLSKSLSTDVREQTDPATSYAQLATSHTIETQQNLETSIIYGNLAIYYNMADQIRLEANVKWYKDKYKTGNIELSNNLGWGVNVSYLFF